MARLRSKIEKTITLILSILENAFNSGIFYGWPSLVFILKQQGYFREGCDTISTGTGANVNTSLFSTTLPEYMYTEYWTDLGTDPVTDIGQVQEVDNMLPCDLQDATFQLVFTVAAFSIQASVFPSGLLFDYVWSRLVRILFRYQTSNNYS